MGQRKSLFTGDLNIYAKYVTAGSSSNQIYQDCLMAGSSSQDATETAYPTNGNRTNLGNTYLSSATVQKKVGIYVQYPFPSGSAVSGSSLYTNGVLVSSSKQAEEIRYASSADLHTRGQVNYWVTGSTIIPAGVATFTTSSFGLGPVNTTAKVSIPVSNFTSLFKSNINDSNDVKGFNILSYNGIISTLTNYNEFSSSINGTTSNFVVIHISASKANMGSVVTSPLYVTLGTTQNSSATRNGNDSTTNVSGHAAFEARYPSGSANRNGRR